MRRLRVGWWGRIIIGYSYHARLLIHLLTTCVLLKSFMTIVTVVEKNLAREIPSLLRESRVLGYLSLVTSDTHAPTSTAPRWIPIEFMSVNARAHHDNYGWRLYASQ